MSVVIDFFYLNLCLKLEIVMGDLYEISLYTFFSFFLDLHRMRNLKHICPVDDPARFISTRLLPSDVD